ncbi:MAG: beta-ketoacyl-[acyl-carrier-protein] synthase family protein [Candidatus Poribacteria bacterium]|nr:beta-ketoacyl-[acyl-carrier-protein] synthase family protein [Candidatus Poribacteria bacterium]
MKKVIVTGVGCLSALGKNAPQFWGRLTAGKTGITGITNFSHQFLRNTKAGEVKTFSSLLEYAEKMSITSRLSLFAHWAIEEALLDSGLHRDSLKDLNVGLVLGVSLGMSLVQQVLECDDTCLKSALNTSSDLSELVNEVAENFAIRGEAIVVSTACASGTNAIGISKDMICYEDYDVVICGGVDTLDRAKYLGHTALNTLTPDSMKPFTPARNGTLFGEGTGILVLSSDDWYRRTIGTSSMAANNQACDQRSPYAVCSGAGYSCDAMHVTAPDDTAAGAIEAIRESLQDAGIGPEAVGYINLHGSGTPLNDAMESTAIATVFGKAANLIPVSSIKPAIGHTMGAAGALEAIATVLSIKHQRIPPMLNVSDEQLLFPLRFICGSSIDAPINHALSNSFGFGGCNGTVLFSRWGDES